MEDDDEECCWECGGQLKYIYTCTNGDVCECYECGSEQLCSSEDEEEDEDGDDNDD